MPHRIVSQAMNANPKHECKPLMQTLKNATTIKCLQTNQMIVTCHMRHIFMPIDQTIILKTKHRQSNTLSCITIKYIFLLIEIRYFILLAINTHIDCANNGKFSARCILKVPARSLEIVSFCIFC